MKTIILLIAVLSVWVLSCKTDFAVTNEPEISLSPEQLYFNRIATGYHQDKTLQIRNIGQSDLNISNLLIEDSQPEFSIQTELSFPLIIPPDGRTDIEIRYEPMDSLDDSGRLLIYSNCPGEEELAVDIVTLDTYPIIDLDKYEVDFGNVPVGNGSANSVTITNIGEATLSVDGIVRIGNDDFSLVDTLSYPLLLPPQESTVINLRFAPSAFIKETATLLIYSNDAANKVVYVNLVGNKDAEGYEWDVEIQLFWNSQADLDLHFLHSGGTWCEGNFDCYWGNQNPDWGNPGDPSDDPLLNNDNTAIGINPEIIYLNRPENGMTYKIGAHLFSTPNEDPIDLTILLFIKGDQVAEMTQQLKMNQFFEAAQFSWPFVTLLPLNVIYDSPPGGQCHQNN